MCLRAIDAHPEPMSLRTTLRSLFTLGKGVFRGLSIEAAGSDPIALFSEWFEDAKRSGVYLPEAATLAIHTMVVLAANPGKTVSAAEIAELLDASSEHLAKVLQRLVRGGFVESSRGPKGGFTLARPADGVALLEVYEYIEGPFEVRDCLLDVRICGIDKCAMGEYLFDANAKLKKFMSETAFGVLAESFAEDVKNTKE